MGFKIIDENELATDFLNSWFDSNDYIIAFTSGSTGKPKPIRLLKQDMVRSAMATNEYFGVTENSALVLPLSCNYIAGKMMILRAIVAECTLYLLPPSNSLVLPEIDIDLIAVVPSQVRSILGYNVNKILIGGAPVNQSLESELSMSDAEIYHSYGMTETCSHVALRKFGSENGSFEAISDFTFSVDKRNCLIINSELFSFTPIITNDVVELVDNRHFVWIGRFDNVINSGGIKISAETVEAKLSELMPIDFYITSAPNNKWGEEIVLVIDENFKDKFENTLAELFSKMRVVLNKYEVPKQILFANIHRTSSGKIIRNSIH